MNADDFVREDHFMNTAQEGARIGVIRAKRAGLPLLRPKGKNITKERALPIYQSFSNNRKKNSINFFCYLKKFAKLKKKIFRGF